MKYLLMALLLASPALLAAEPHEEFNDSPEKIVQLKKDAVSLEQQVKASPKETELYIKLGFTYARLHQADDAQRAFETATTLDPKRAIAHYMLGLIYEKKGLKDKAIAAWKACLENAHEERLRETAIRHLHHLSRD